jgi:hypothetical protein
MRDIAPDERRRERQNGARRFAVARRGAPGASRGLSVDTATACAALLPGAPHRAITLVAGIEYGP